MPKTKVITVELVDGYRNRCSASFDLERLARHVEIVSQQVGVDADDITSRLEIFVTEKLRARMKALSEDLHWDALQEALAAIADITGGEFVPYPKEKAVAASPYLKELRSSRRKKTAGRKIADVDPADRDRLIASIRDTVSTWKRDRPGTMPSATYVARSINQMEADPLKKLRRDLKKISLEYPSDFATS